MRLPLGAFFLKRCPFVHCIKQFVHGIKLRVSKKRDGGLVPIEIARMSLSGLEQPRQHSGVANGGLGGWFERGKPLSRGRPSIDPRILHSLEVIVIQNKRAAINLASEVR